MKKYKIMWRGQEYIIKSDNYLHAKNTVCEQLGLSMKDSNALIARAGIVVWRDNKWYLISAED